MKEKNYWKWVGKRVVRASAPDGVRGVVNEPAPTYRWWRVWWDSGKQTVEPERTLIQIPDERKQH